MNLSRSAYSLFLVTLLACGSHKAAAPPVATAEPSAAPAASSAAPAAPEPAPERDLMGTANAPDPVIDGMEAGVRKLAETHAPKMSNESSLNVRKGGSASDTVTLVEGRCYTVIGYSPAGGAQEIKISLGTKYVGKSKPAKSGDAVSAVLLEGKSALCVKKTADYPLKIEATKGEGPLAVDLFGRPDSK